ncbi:MAG TPA: PIN domain-containing protein [Candidatus Nanoarchaeia archaeon]|nr:PIN domain-containing protein [Candidatus Nanoarchaeia archaeon]
MYCLDTYALWEIQLGNQKYSRFLTEEFIITDWTAAEFYRTLLREHDIKTADYWFRKLRPYCRQVPVEILIKAILFQAENSKNRISLFDCVGYMFSKENRMVFVTGDKEFEKRPGVAYIKK